jgi:hypothetical protein
MIIQEKQIVILHLMPDDKFLDNAINQFDPIPNCQNLFLVFLPENQQKPTYVKSTKIRIVRNIDDIIRETNLFNCIDGIIIHFYSDWNAEAMIKLKTLYPDVIVFWIAWGADFYHSINFPLYQKTTKKMIDKRRSKIRKLLSTVKSTLIKKQTVINWKEQGMPLIDYCANIVPNEFKLMKDLQGFRAKQIRYSYTTDSTIAYYDGIIKRLYLGDNVLIGNSATESNNHLDAFNQIKHTVGNDFTYKYIVPLNYGDTKWYGPKIIKKGRKYFGEQFQPLLNFLPKKDYFDLISSCKVAIFNCQRQQAMGNVYSMLLFGVRVYLPETNPSFEYLKSIGIFIFSLQTDFEKYKFSKLEDKYVEINRKILFETIFNKKFIKTNIDNIVEIIRVPS